MHQDVRHFSRHFWRAEEAGRASRRRPPETLVVGGRCNDVPQIRQGDGPRPWTEAACVGSEFLTNIESVSTSIYIGIYLYKADYVGIRLFGLRIYIRVIDLDFKVSGIFIFIIIIIIITIITYNQEIHQIETTTCHRPISSSCKAIKSHTHLSYPSFTRCLTQLPRQRPCHPTTSRGHTPRAKHQTTLLSWISLICLAQERQHLLVTPPGRSWPTRHPLPPIGRRTTQVPTVTTRSEALGVPRGTPEVPVENGRTKINGCSRAHMRIEDI